MEHTKLQAGCLIVLIYISFIYIFQCRRFHKSHRETFFSSVLVLGVISVLLDGATAYTVNNMQSVPAALNTALHALFLISLDSVIFALFLYMLLITGMFPQKAMGKCLVFLPFAVNIIVVLAAIGSLEYIPGRVTNYSMGTSAYTCFATAGIYILLSIVIFIGRWRWIESQKRASIFTYLLVLALVATVQMIFPEVLISSIAVTVFIIGIYMNLENPALLQLAHYHKETVMSFSTLIENRDASTGGHIKRTSRYVHLIAEELQRRGHYADTLTKDYITNLIKAAPMHDIGKVAVADSILQKPGKLTNEEFIEMQAHTVKGGEIIEETFAHLGSEEYLSLARSVARHHHEKWNGSGYPDGLCGEEIPLCARIMAVADVFDAVSDDRCYRKALPLDECFNIIAEGAGTHFDPIIAKVFLDIRGEVAKTRGELYSHPVQS